MLQNAGVSQTGPFYPIEYQKKGFPLIYIGFIMGTFAVVYIFSSMWTGQNLSWIGRARGLKYGLFLIIIQLVMMGSLEFVDNQYFFVGLSFVAQTLGGIGAGLNSTCAMAIISSFFPDSKEDNITVLEIGIGIGLLVGPLLGAFLYTIGGYILPFWTVAVICMLLYPLLLHTVAFIQREENKYMQAQSNLLTPEVGAPIKEVTEAEEHEEEDSPGKKYITPKAEQNKVTFLKMCKVPMFVFGLAAQVLVYGGIQFLGPVMSLHLLSYEGFDEFWVGVYFGVPPIIYILNGLMVAFVYCKLINRRLIVLIGMSLFSLAILCIGTSPFLGLPDQPKVIFMGLNILGFSTAMVVIPLLPEMQDSIVAQFPELEGDDLNNQSSGYFNSFLGVGEAIGPISASLMCNSFGFRASEDFIGGSCIIYVVLFICLCGGIKIFTQPPKESAEVLEQDDQFKNAGLVLNNKPPSSLSRTSIGSNFIRQNSIKELAGISGGRTSIKLFNSGNSQDKNTSNRGSLNDKSLGGVSLGKDDASKYASQKQQTTPLLSQ